MIHKQGAEYQESADVAGVEEPTDVPEKKIKLPQVLLIAGFVAVVVILLLVAILHPGRNAPAQDVPGQSEEGAIIGDDDYWSQFEIAGYTDEERQSLRAWGYTGTEIEENEANGVLASELIESSKRAQEELQAALSDPASPEYQELLNNTWLGQQALHLPTYEEEVTEQEIYYNSFTYNADYDKVPAHGHTLFLKVYLEDGSYTFMECPFIRYLQLPESGNIVVQYQTSTINGVTIISDMREVTVE